MISRWLSLNAIAVVLASLVIGVGCGPECPKGQTKCGEVCVNTQTDRANCGACGTACEDGKVCNQGSCAVSCQTGLTNCEGSCVNTKSNTANCGACGTTCKAGEVCDDGTCKLSCPDGQTACSGACVITNTDTAHCGSCGNACEQGQTCKDGKCEVVCTTAQTACDGTCVDTKSNFSHCGACGTKCDPGQVCNTSKCELSCQTGLTDCSGSCINTQTDSQNCGACGTVCDAGKICKAGKCELNCATDYQDCNGVCTNTKLSREHCGACDNKCNDGYVCTDGKCGLSCQSGLTNCSDKCVNTQTNSAHCGACGTACKTGEVCQSGKCELYCQPGFTNCGGSCVNIQFDDKNCGKCGTACQASESCQSGKCAVKVTCSGGDTACGGTCVNISHNPKHCGGCGIACKTGEACIRSQCKASTDSPTWVTNVGAFNSDYVYDVAVDSKGNVYATGYFNTAAKFGSEILTGQGGDIFVVKMAPSGRVMWAAGAGGSNSDYGYGVAADSNGNVYVTGYIDTSATFGTISLSTAGRDDIFVAKLDSNGKWLWAKNYGSSSNDEGTAIAVDSSGNAYVTGRFYSSVKFGTFTLSSQGSSDVFVGKWDTSGNVVWVGSAGSSSSDYGEAITLDSSGNVYVAGRFYSSVTLGTLTLSSQGSSDVFVAKFDNKGALQWATSGGGSSLDYAYGIAVDSSGNVAVTGAFSSSGATFGSTSLSSSGSYDIFVATLDNKGAWKWAVSAGSSNSDYGYGVVFDSQGNVFAAGYFDGAATFGKAVLTPPSTSNQIFLMQIDKTGKILGAIQAGDEDSDYAYALTIDSNDNLYMGGYFGDLVRFGDRTLLSNGGSDGFVAKYPKPTGALCPQQGGKVCSGACIDVSSDPSNCGACGTTCKSEEVCAGGQCQGLPQGLVLQEVNTGNPDYVAIKNTGTKDINLSSVYVYLNYNSTFSGYFNEALPNYTLKAGATVYCVESSPKANEIKCPSIPLVSSHHFVTMLCFGKCTASSAKNVLDVLYAGSSTRPLPSGISFTPAGVTRVSSDSQSYIRKATAGKNPTFLQSDWSTGAKTR